MEKEIKCIVWDLDNTLWDGVVLEDGNVVIKPGIIDLIKELDGRGILHSIASKNHFEDAMAKLKEFQIDEYFLYPEIHWNAKSISIANIQNNLNIGMDTILFIDDQAFEREEVKSVHPEVQCLDVLEIDSLLTNPRLYPRFITEDSKRRRQMYLEDIQRKKEEDDYEGPQEKFLSSLRMKLTISEAGEEDLKRAEELTVRTNQLNATGRTYSYEELNGFRLSGKYKLLICELEDKFGSYGKIGLALIELEEAYWHLKLLLMSCRVMSRGLGSVLLTYIMHQAKAAGKKLLADFKYTDRNKMMYVAYRFANFNELEKHADGRIVFENDLSQIQQLPGYIRIEAAGSINMMKGCG